MTKHHVLTMLPKFFCLRLLTWKQKLIHSFFNDVNVELWWVPWPTHSCNRSRYTTHLILLSVVFLTTMVFDNVSSFLLYVSALHTSLARVQGFSLMVATHNSTVLKVNGTTEDIFICNSFKSKIFVSSHKKEVFFNHFHNLHFHNLVYLQDPGCALYVQPLKQPQENYQIYTLKDNLS